MGSRLNYTCNNCRAYFKDQTHTISNGRDSHNMSFHCQDCSCVFVLGCEADEDIIEIAKSKQCVSCKSKNIKMWDGKCVYCNSELEAKINIYDFYD